MCQPASACPRCHTHRSLTRGGRLGGSHPGDPWGTPGALCGEEQALKLLCGRMGHWGQQRVPQGRVSPGQATGTSRHQRGRRSFHWHPGTQQRTPTLRVLSRSHQASCRSGSPGLLGIRVGAPGRPSCPQRTAPALPSGCLCHSPSSSRLEVAAQTDGTPRLRPAHPDPTRAHALGKHTLHWEGGICSRITPGNQEAHPTPSHPLQRGPAGAGPQRPRESESRSLGSATPRTIRCAGSPGQSAGVGRRFLPQGIVPAEGSRKDPAVARPSRDRETTRGPPAPALGGAHPKPGWGDSCSRAPATMDLSTDSWEETTQKPDAPCTPQPGLGGARSSEPPSSQSPECLRSGCQGSHH